MLNHLLEVDPESILFTCVLKPKAIYSERDLETEFAKLAFILKDDRTADVLLIFISRFT